MGMSLANLDIGGAFSGLGKLIGSVRTAITGEESLTSEARAALEGMLGKLEDKALDLQGKVVNAQEAIIVAEAQGGSWLQRNWRPVVMLWFVVLIGAHWFGFTAENLSEEQVLKLLDIVKIGLGGYVVGRSAEKCVKYYRK
jgi:hypothetical protein